MMRTVATLSFATLSLVACASQRGEDNELPETLVDGAADSWSHPTKFGTLFERTWQFGQLDPDQNIRNAAYMFTVDGSARVTITTRSAPVEEHETDLYSSVVYLYKQTDAGTHRRIAKTTAGDDFGVLTKDLDAGTYRVLVKGVEARDAGEFMIRLDCEGDGCVDEPQCLFGDGYYDLSQTKRGAIEHSSRTVLTLQSFQQQLGAALQKDQIIAAVNQSAHEVTTIEEAFSAVDGEEINRDSYIDTLGGRRFRAFEYGAGDNSYGAIFQGNDPTPVVAINDGDLYECTVFAQTCAFGRSKGEAEYMPGMTSTDYFELTSPASVPADLEQQLITALSYDGNVPTLQEVFESVDEGTISVTKYRHDDGREFVGFDYYSGDTPVGAFFAKGGTEELAEIGDGEVENCKAFL